MSPSENESHPLQLSPEAPAPGKSKRLRLLPVELNSQYAVVSPKGFGSEQPDDLNNKRPTQKELVNPNEWASKLDALVIFYDKVWDSSAKNVRDFDIGMNPTSAPPFTWSKKSGPDSGSLINTGATKYSNPKNGGLYRFDCTYPSGKIGAQALLPLAGAEMKTWILQEVRNLKAITEAHKKKVEEDNYSSIPGMTSANILGVFAANSGTDFDYNIDPVSDDRSAPSLPLKPKTRYEGGDEWTMYSYVTVGGTVLHGSKINNLLWGAFGYYWGWSGGQLQTGASVNQFARGLRLGKLQLDNRSSQEAVMLGAYMARIYSMEPNTSLLWQVTSQKSVWEALIDETSLIEEKLWPAKDGYSQSNSTFTRPVLTTKKN
jgi:hypothetical protein